MTFNPLVFVAMPFGKKSNDKTTIDFDSIYDKAIKASLQDYNMDVMRADDEILGGFIHGPMYERLLLAEIVIADLTMANANVFYELGIRHCAKPKSTILIYSSDSRLPFDVSPLRAIPYELDEGILSTKEAEKLKNNLQLRLDDAATEGSPDSPLFQLISQFPGVNLKLEQTESFREKLRTIETLHEELLALRYSKKTIDQKKQNLTDIETRIGNFHSASQELLFNLVLTYRAIEDWDHMVKNIEKMPEGVRNSVNVQEQYALGLNRRNHDDDRENAIRIMERLIDQYGKSSESMGIIGRFYKDRYHEYLDAGNKLQANGALKKAIQYYHEGFIQDPRDYYPGINALTYMFIENSTESQAEFQKLKPLVEFAIERQYEKDKTNYWVLASMLEINVLNNDWGNVQRTAEEISQTHYDQMQLNTTVNNLNDIVAQLKVRGEQVQELEEIMNQLQSE